MDVVDLCGDDLSDTSCASRPAKRQKHEPSLTHVSNTIDDRDGASHVSETLREAPEAASPPAAAEAQSPTLSPEQVRAALSACKLHWMWGHVLLSCLFVCSKKL